LNFCTETPEEILNSDPKVDDLVAAASASNSNQNENNNNNNEQEEQSNNNNNNFTENNNDSKQDDSHYKALPSQGNAQTLSTDQIMEMKEKGISTSKLVHSIVQSSTTFNDRTEWSKKKYILKKRKRHTEIWWTVKPSAFSLADHYFFDGKSDKIRFLNLFDGE